MKKKTQNIYLLDILFSSRFFCDVEVTIDRVVGMEYCRLQCGSCRLSYRFMCTKTSSKSFKYKLTKNVRFSLTHDIHNIYIIHMQNVCLFAQSARLCSISKKWRRNILWWVEVGFSFYTVGWGWVCWMTKLLSLWQALFHCCEYGE